jgi:hypothetical protein
MAGCKDIPLFKDLNYKNPIDVQTEKGVIQVTPFHVRRGEGKMKWVIEIDGLCRSEPPIATQCYVIFKGHELGASFHKVSQQQGVSRLDYGEKPRRITE